MYCCFLFTFLWTTFLISTFISSILSCFYSLALLQQQRVTNWLCLYNLYFSSKFPVLQQLWLQLLLHSWLGAPTALHSQLLLWEIKATIAFSSLLHCFCTLYFKWHKRFCFFFFPHKCAFCQPWQSFPSAALSLPQLFRPVANLRDLRCISLKVESRNRLLFLATFCKEHL